MLYSFEDYVLDSNRRELRRGTHLVAVEPQVFDLLHFLIRHRDRVVTRDNILDAVWNGRAVSESALAVRINAARLAISDNGQQQRLIRTLPRKGLRFIGDVREHGAAPARDAEGAVKAQTRPDVPSIAVLPFTNMSEDAGQEYFADGISEDIITALCRFRSLLVIARNSTFTYKGRAVDVKDVARELGVRYVLEGSVREAGRRVRVTAQLIDAETGIHVWAERYERPLQDIFAVQDEITHAVSTAIAPAVAEAERHRAVRRSPDTPDTWSAYQRGQWHLSRANPEDNKAAQKCFSEAIALDANFSGGYTGLALAQMQESGLFATRSVADARISIKALALRAVANDESDAEAHACLSWALNFDGDYDGALAEAQRALAISPNCASAHRALGTTLIFAGKPKEGLVALETTIRLDPRDPLLAWHLNRMAIGHYYAHNYEAAVETARRVARLYPDFPLIYRWLAAALGQTGRAAEARHALDKAIAICGGGSFDMYVRQRVPWHRVEDYEHMLDGLRKAGWQG